MSDYVYLDWAASAPVKYFTKDYYIPGNPNSPHALGLQANQALNEARQRIMDCLGVKSGKVLFCRCATEAVEWLCNKYRERAIDINLNRKIMGEQFNQYERLSIWCSQYEHDSVQAVTPEYQDDWRNCGLYLHQYINQLTGTVFPIESIGKQVQSTGTFFGSDITAGLGKYPLPQNLDTFCDAVWFSGRKIHCETMGAIWLSDRLFKYLGGSEDSRNEFGLLHGTANVPGAIALSYAVEHAIDEAWVIEAKTKVLIIDLVRGLRENGIDFSFVADNQSKSYAINAITFPGVNADALTQYLSSKSIYISPGHSACTSDDSQATRVLEAFGLTKEQASQTVRISFGESTTTEDIDALVQGIVEFKNLFV